MKPSFVLIFFVFNLLLSTHILSQEIETVTIGDQEWMKYNLKTDVLGSICYNKDSINWTR